MKYLRTNVKIVSWRKARAFAVPIALRKSPRASRFNAITGTTAGHRWQCPRELMLFPNGAIWLTSSIRNQARRRILGLVVAIVSLATGLLAAETTNAPVKLGTNATPATPLTNAIAPAKTNSVARAVTNAPPRLDYASFKIVADRSIFDPNRSRRSSRGDGGPERKPVKIESFTLVGTMSYAKGDVAFFDGTESKYRKAFKLGELIGGYKLTAILANSVKIEKEGKVLEMFLGAQLKKRDDEPWELLASTLSLVSNYKPKSGTNADASAGDDEVLKRLMERRKKEAE